MAQRPPIRRRAWALFGIGAVALTGIGCYESPTVIAESSSSGFALYRSGRLSHRELKRLCSDGVEEIVVLDGSAGELECRMRETACPGLRVRYNRAQNEDTPVSAEFLDAFDDWIEEAQREGRKISFRCTHGWHRTGRLAAYYRLRFEEAPPAETIEEMKWIGGMMFKHPTLGPQVAAYAELVAGRECAEGPEACPPWTSRTRASSKVSSPWTPAPAMGDASTRRLARAVPLLLALVVTGLSPDLKADESQGESGYELVGQLADE